MPIGLREHVARLPWSTRQDVAARSLSQFALQIRCETELSISQSLTISRGIPARLRSSLLRPVTVPLILFEYQNLMRQATTELQGATTLDRTIRHGNPDSGGYRRLESGPGELHILRRELGGSSERLYPLCSFIHLSDLHVTDVQSPARTEYLDRLGDEDSPFAAEVGRVGLYRPQEALTAQVVEAMARATRRIDQGPVTGAIIDFALSTGDATDNCTS